MAVFQTTRHGTLGYGNGLEFSGNYVADPDIYAQGEQARKTQQQQIDWQKQKTGALLPYLDRMMNAGLSASSMPGPAYVGQQPRIQGGQIWSKDAIQQNLNANRAQIDQQTATNTRTTNNQLAGRGFGTRSPLAMALQGQGAQSAMAQKADYARQFVPQARQANASHALNVGQAQEAQFASRNKEYNDRRQIQANQQSSLFNALGGLIGSL